MYKQIIMILLSILCLIGCQTIEEKVQETNEKTAAKEVSSEAGKQAQPANQTEETIDSNGSLTVHYIDVGQGNATLLHYQTDQDHYTILYDTGDWLGSEVVPYLQAQGISKLDIVIISHPHADHIGQLKNVVEQIQVDEVWMTGNEANSVTFSEALEAVLASDANYEEPRAGDLYDVGPLEITVLHPEKLTGELNEDSLSIHVQYGEIAFLFTGDATTNEEKFITEQYPNIRAQFLQVGHHGSNTSSGMPFIEAIDPDYAIYSAGIDNSYGHPHDEVVSRFEKEGIPLYGTDIFGTIVVTTDGISAEITTEKQGGTTIADKKAQKESKERDSAPEQSGSCIDINHAPKEELMEIKHIGDARAVALIALRPFTNLDELTKIKGISNTRMKEIKAENKACIGGDGP